MKVDSDVVISLRIARSWSQEELASASGLNLRTIQRIEREGVISLQSKKALAAAFDINISELDYIERRNLQRYEYKTVVFDNDVKWLSGWGKKKAQGPFKLDEQINEYARLGWKICSVNHGSSVHGGAGQVSILFEREYLDELYGKPLA